MSLPLEAAGLFQHKISIYSSNLGEPILRAAVIVLTRAQDGARKLRLIWAVGVCLRLNGDAAVRPVRGRHGRGGVYLHGGEVGVYIQPRSAVLDGAGVLAREREAVVIIARDAPYDGKVELSLRRHDAPRRDEPAVYLQPARRGYLHGIVQHVVPAEVEVHMRGGGVHRVRAAHAAEVEPQRAALDGVGHARLQLAGEAVVPVGGDQREAHGGLRQHLRAPLALIV